MALPAGDACEERERALSPALIERSGAVAMALLAAACSRGDAPAAPVQKAPLPGRAEWRVECRPVKDDRHQACYGPGWEEGLPREPGRFHFYQVSVERKQASDAPHVLFVKRLATGDVDAKLLEEGDGAAVARYDPASRSVSFAVGREPIVFPLDPVR
jgi:hypothetical protein